MHRITILCGLLLVFFLFSSWAEPENGVSPSSNEAQAQQYMTTANCISGAIYSKGHPIREKIQIYLLAAVFLVILYSSPAGLVLYWAMTYSSKTFPQKQVSMASSICG